MRRIALTATLAATGALVAATHAAGQDTRSASQFVTGLYGAYHGHGPDYLGAQAAEVFSPRLLKLIRRDQALAKGEVGALDGDPICNCQDFRLGAMVDVKVAMTRPGEAKATARFRNFGKPQAVRLDLVAVNGAWRVDNIHEDGTPDLVAYLQKHAGGR